MQVLQIIVTILSSSVRFAMTFPLVIMQFKFSFLETLLWTNVGGVLGIYFFAFLSEQVMAWWKGMFRKRRSRIKGTAREKKVFTKRNRRIVRIKQRYGFLGIAITTPLLLSIPVGASLVVRYYRSRRIKFTYLIASDLVWSVLYTLFYTFWDGLLFTRA